MKWWRNRRNRLLRESFWQERYDEAWRVLTGVFPYYPKDLVKTYACVYADEMTRDTFGKAASDDEILATIRGGSIDGQL